MKRIIGIIAVVLAGLELFAMDTPSQIKQRTQKVAVDPTQLHQRIEEVESKWQARGYVLYSKDGFKGEAVNEAAIYFDPAQGGKDEVYLLAYVDGSLKIKVMYTTPERRAQLIAEETQRAREWLKTHPKKQAKL